MKKYILLILYINFLNNIFSQEKNSSFRFINHDFDGGSVSLASSDMILASSSALFNNPAGITLSDSKFEFALSYKYDFLLNNTGALFSIFDLFKGKMGIKFFYLFLTEKDTYFFSKLYSAYYWGITYSFLLAKFDFFSLYNGFGLNLANENILKTAHLLLLLDYGLLISLFDKKLFFAFSVNNLGYSYSLNKIFYKINLGAKYIFTFNKYFNIGYSFKISNEEYFYSLFSFGINLNFFKNYSILVGYKTDILNNLSLNSSLNLGLKITYKNFNIDLCYVPFTEIQDQFLLTMKYLYKGKKKPPTKKNIKLIDMSIQKIISGIKKAVKKNDWEYAFELVKEGLCREPDNNTLFEILNKIKSREDIKKDREKTSKKILEFIEAYKNKKYDKKSGSKPEFRKKILKEIKKMKINEILKEIKKALKYNEISYALLLIKIGHEKYPTNDKLIDHFMAIKEQKSE